MRQTRQRPWLSHRRPFHERALHPETVFLSRGAYQSYRGLLALEEQDADFFGRELETGAILITIIAKLGRLIALIGNSGSTSLRWCRLGFHSVQTERAVVKVNAVAAVEFRYRGNVVNPRLLRADEDLTAGH